MAKSKLKTLISEYLDIKRGDIEFIYPENNSDNIIIKDTNTDEYILFLSPGTDPFCCGILALGETDWNNNIEDLDIETRNELGVELFNQIQRMIMSKNGDGINESLITWSHTEDNIFTQALLSEYNTEDMPWKLASKFLNKNSGNIVYYFTSFICGTIGKRTFCLFSSPNYNFDNNNKYAQGAGAKEFPITDTDYHTLFKESFNKEQEKSLVIEDVKELV